MRIQYVEGEHNHLSDLKVSTALGTVRISYSNKRNAWHCASPYGNIVFVGHEARQRCLDKLTEKATSKIERFVYGN